jgi:NADPH-dependent 2,4-dienoyl-CoA reductase/sulfur reductase-like enzyme
VDLDDAERILAAGAADAVGMTRALIADPELIVKAYTGRAEEVIECIGCNQACIGHYHAGVPIGCVVNPRTGRERTLPRSRRAEKRRVLVAGGGPAGVAAALAAAEAGDDVTLRERSDGLGGQLRLAGRAPAHLEMWERWSRSMGARIRRAGVHLELNNEVEPGTLAEDWDLLVVATGARPYRPPLPAVDGIAVIPAWDAIAAPADVTGPVLVADWGGEWSGLDAAEVLRSAGHDVELLCAATHPGETLHQYQRNLYLSRLDSAGIRIRHHTELAAPDGELILRHVFSGRCDSLPPAGTIVVAHGRSPEDGLWIALDGKPGVVRAGDVLGPRSAEEATLEGVLSVTGEGVAR